MTIYADEAFYEDEYLQGREAVITASFPYYMREASLIIKQYTLDNIDEENIPDEVRMCCCELAEAVFSRDAKLSQTGTTTSESVGGWSKSYVSAESVQAAFGGMIQPIVYKWLSDTGLLYRGVREC